MSVQRSLLLQLGPQVERSMVQAAGKAGTSALRAMRAELNRVVRERKRIKLKAIRRVVRVRRRKSKSLRDLRWTMRVRAKRIPLHGYPHRRVKAGISVEINRGQRSLVRGGFLATMRSGHRGIFLRRGKKRLPIDEQFGSTVVHAVSRRVDQRRILRAGQKTFEKRFRALVWR